MSDTDDTDELLIIPPDFFLASSESNNILNSDFIPYYNVVDSLITQVNSLEDRINSIQSSSNVSLDQSFDRMHNSMSRLRKFNSSDDLLYNRQRTCSIPESTQSTPQKPRNKFTLNSLPSTPSVDQYKPQSPKKTPLKSRKDGSKFHNKRAEPTNPMLGEIDNFISNVKMIKRLNAARNLECDYSIPESHQNRDSKSVDAKEVEEMLRDLECQYRQNEERIKEGEDALEKPFHKEKTWQPGDNIDSVPDFGYGMRQHFYPEITEIYTRDKVNKNQCEAGGSDASSDSTQVTAFKVNDKGSVHSNAVNVLNMHKSLLDNGDFDFNLGMMSLSRMWNQSKGDLADLPTKFQLKIQEERLRRKHCEDTIKNLQNRVLELQEKIAVAVEVDEAKDKAIVRFHECWQETGSKLLEMEKDKLKLECENEKLKKQIHDETEELSKKINHYEIEASKALNIAHSTQEKLSSFELKYLDAKNLLETLQYKYDDLQIQYSLEKDKCRQFPEIIAQKELELNESKTVINGAREEVSQCRKAVENCQAELSSLGEERDSLKSELRNQIELCSKLSEQKSKLIEEVNAHKNIEASLQEELMKTRDQLESNKVELKNFYQGQVELVVQNKLKEFQTQLDDAEKNLKEELAKKEMSIARVAASHIQQLQDKYSLEIKLLEAKHQEECRLYQLHQSKIQKDLEESNGRLQRQQFRQSQMERVLQKFMDSLRQDNSVAADDFKSKSFNNLEELLSWKGQEDDKGMKNEFGEDSQLTYRVPLDTPVTSKGENKGAKKRENSLQETIQMLLDRRVPGESKTQAECQQVTRDDLLPLLQRFAKEAKRK